MNAPPPGPATDDGDTTSDYVADVDHTTPFSHGYPAGMAHVPLGGLSRTSEVEMHLDRFWQRQLASIDAINPGAIAAVPGWRAGTRSRCRCGACGPLFKR